MGRQIEIAHDSQDDDSLIAAFEAAGDFRFLPRIAPSGAVLLPRTLGENTGLEHAVFLAKHAQHVMDGSHVSPSNPAQVVVSHSDNDGVIIEWSRTERAHDGAYIGSGGGRLYMSSPAVSTPASDELRRILFRIFRWIQRTHPWLTEDGYIYVGASLGARVIRGEARLVYPNGTALAIKPNPKFVDPARTVAQKKKTGKGGSR